MVRILFILMFVPILAYGQTFNASKRIVGIQNYTGIIRLIHYDSSRTDIPKESIGFVVCYPNPSKAVQITTISGGSNNYTYGFLYDDVGQDWSSQYEAVDTISAWIAQNSIPTLASGIYTPTLYKQTNIDTFVAYPCQYFRVGSTVTVSGRVDITLNTNGPYELDISLPIPSNFTNEWECVGSSVGVVHSASAVDLGYIQANVLTDRAAIRGDDNDVSNHGHYFQFTYTIK
jgi:hypothetical protein